MRRRFAQVLLSAVCLAAVAVPAQADDRQIASQIAEVMRISGAMSDYDIAVKYSERTAWLRGRVASSEQMATAVAVAQASPHVDKVVNQLAMAKSRSGKSRPAQMAARRGNNRIALASARQPLRRAAPVPFGSSSLPGSPQQLIRPVMGMAAAPGAALAGGGPRPAFVPGTGGGVAPATYDQPSLPGHAWPSYAAYPNYAGLTYPKQYSPTAWPYIGPFYPYPQVPLGWRKVSLEWDDGWWFLDFKDH
ncbi:MAG: BON domain-containing protein [Planctomycetota bacterium]|nr:BON domain-containing protein [Planctomycetota bacterium]